MKKIVYLLVVVLCSCSAKELTKEQAADLIREANGYPKDLSDDIYRATLLVARKMLDSGFEKEGWVSIVKFQSVKDLGKPLIYFESKAKPFLLPTPARDSGYLQIVRVAVIDLDRITGIKVDGNTAKVEYTLTFENRTPFYKMLEHKPDPTKKHYACFELYDIGWKLVRCLY